MRKKIDPVVDEAIETLNMKDGPSRRRLLEGAGLFSATAAASALIAACSSSSSSSAAPTVDGEGSRGQLPDHAQVEVHVREPRHGQRVLHPDPVRLARTRPRCSACRRRPGPARCPPSRRTPPCCRPSTPRSRPVLRASRPPSSRPPRSSRPSTARCRRASPWSPTTRTVPPTTPPTAWPTSARSCYMSGQEVGKRLASLMKKGDTAVGVIAQPGSLNIQPRMDGATQALEAAGMKVHVRQQGPRLGRLGDAGSPGHPPVPPGERVQDPGHLRRRRRQHRPARHLAGRRTTWSARCTPAASTWSRRPWPPSRPARSTSPSTSRRTCRASCPRMYLYLFQLSGGLVAPPTTDTGLKFVVKGNVDPYTATADPVRGLDEEPGVRQAHRADLRSDRLSARHWEVAGPWRFTGGEATVSRHGAWV